MISHIHQSIRLWTLLLLTAVLSRHRRVSPADAQTIGCEYQCPNRPTIQLHPNAGIAPQTGVLQNLTDPTIINILPGKVVDRGAFNRPPPQPNIQILGQQNGQPGQPGQPGTPGITRINGMPPVGETRFVPDQVLVMSRGALPQQVLDRIAAVRLDADRTAEPDDRGRVHLRVPHQRPEHDVGAGCDPAPAGRQSRQRPADPAELSVPGGAAAQPAPASANQSQQGDATQYVVEKWKLGDVHRLVTGNNVIIAVIDSEIDTGHPDLAGVVRQRFSAVGAPEQPHPHGTGMAGAIASHQRLVGIAPNARLLAVHAFSTKAATAESTTFQILKGIDWSVLQGARILNMSFAGPRDPSLERALKAAYDRNVVLIAAAGNAGPKSPPLFPGADPNVIAVTATDVDDKLFTGANRGRYVAIAAPGVDVLVPAPQDAYQLTTGTSVAAAEVSGVVALMLERNPKLRPADVRRILTSTARRLGTAPRDDNFGAGLVDPLRAIQAATDPRISSVAPRR